MVPVYGDWPSLKDCIESLKKHVNKKHIIILVNDNGPEADEIERNIIHAIKGQNNFKYYRNSQNLGFVGTCNKAVTELDKSKNDILLLNSDTKATNGFLEEMQTVLYSAKNGTVSPRSNNATICTIPLVAMAQKGIGADKSYELFQRYSRKFPRYYSIPTAHGFCMLIRRELINKYGLFDSIFGKGYGEEVDFCQRILKHGWSNVLSNWSFVYHLEARSFSLEAKKKMIENNSKIILHRYPSYKRDVTNHINRHIEEEKKIFGKVLEKYVPQEGDGLMNILKRSNKINLIVNKLRNRINN